MTHHHHFTLQTADLTVMCRCRQTRQVCAHCRFSFVWAKGLCRACYQFQWNHGTPRPDHLIEAHARSLLARKTLSRSA